jgi:hypothetical protein
MTAVISARASSVNGPAGGEEQMNAASNPIPNSRRKRSRLVARTALRLVLAAAIATALVGFGMHAGPSRIARGGEDPPPSQNEVARAALVTGFHRTLKAYDNRLIGLAKQALDQKDPRHSALDQLVKLRIDEKKAEAEYKNAKLEREIAEIAVIEYSQGVFPQELTSVEGELALAKSDMERGRDLVAIAKERQEKIKEVADEDTAYGRIVNFDYGDRVALAMMREQQSKFTLEVAETKKKILVEYTKPKRTKELQAEVARAHAKELAKEADWERLKGQVESLEKTTRTPPARSEVEKRILGLLDRAIPIEERAHAKLDQLARERKAGDSLQKEVQDLTNELGAIVEEAESVKAAGDFARLKSRLKQAALQAGVAAAK